MSTHWAAQLVGQPYEPGADGPDAFDCWGLVRHVFRTQLEIDLPSVAVRGGTDNAPAIRSAAGLSGWTCLGDMRDLLPWDVVAMIGMQGRHVGVAVSANGRVGVLHAIEVAGVMFSLPQELQDMGYTHFRVWRRREETA